MTQLNINARRAYATAQSNAGIAMLNLADNIGLNITRIFGDTSCAYNPRFEATMMSNNYARIVAHHNGVARVIWATDSADDTDIVRFCPVCRTERTISLRCARLAEAIRELRAAREALSDLDNTAQELADMFAEER